MTEPIARAMQHVAQTAATAAGPPVRVLAQQWMQAAEDAYVAAQPSSIFSVFYQIHGWRLNASKAPHEQLEALNQLYIRLEDQVLSIPIYIQVLHLIASLPQVWHTYLSNFLLQVPNPANVTWDTATNTIKNYWDTLQVPSRQQKTPLINQILAVQHQPGTNPTWQQQMQSGVAAPKEKESRERPGGAPKAAADLDLAGCTMYLRNPKLH